MLRITDKILEVCKRYIEAPEAQKLLDKYCNNIGITRSQITSENVALVVLEIAKAREDFENLDEDNFYRFMDRLIVLANSCYDSIEADEKEALIAAIVGEKNSCKYNDNPAIGTENGKYSRKKDLFVDKLDLPIMNRD